MCDINVSFKINSVSSIASLRAVAAAGALSHMRPASTRFSSA
jgi:hypothetical protein